MRTTGLLVVAMVAGCMEPPEEMRPPPKIVGILEVTVLGPGFVRSDDGAIDCPTSRCRVEVPLGTVVRLTGEPDQGRLISILGPCTGPSPACEVTVDGRRGITYRYADTSGGAVEWSRAIGSPTSMVGVTHISHGAGARAWVAGVASGRFSLGGPEEGLSTDFTWLPFVAQYEEDDGGYVAERRFTVTGNAAPASVVAMAGGGFLFAARYSRTFDLGGEVVGRVGNCPGEGMVLARYDEGLNRVWSKGFGGASCGSPNAGLDSAGGIILSGALLDPMDFGGGLIGGGGGKVLFGATFDADGGFSQSFAVPAMITTRVFASAVVGLPDGGILLAGSFSGPFPLGGVTLSSTRTAGFLAAYTPAGQELWSNSIGFADGGLVTSMALDPGGDLYVLGEFSGTLVLQGASVTSRGDVDVFVARFTGRGELVWLRSFGGPSIERGGSIVMTAKGVAVSGSYHFELQVEAQTLTSMGTEDVFVIGMSREGEVRWARTFGSPGPDRAGALGATGDGGLLLAGSFGASASNAGFSIPDAGARNAAFPAPERGSVLLRLCP